MFSGVGWVSIWFLQFPKSVHFVLFKSCSCQTTALFWMAWFTFRRSSCLTDVHTVPCLLFYETNLTQPLQNPFPLIFFEQPFWLNASKTLIVVCGCCQCIWWLIRAISSSVTHCSKTFLSMVPESPKVIWWSWHHLQLLLYLIYKSSVTNLIPGFNFQFN